MLYVICCRAQVPAVVDLAVFSQNAPVLIALCSDASICLWNVATRKQLSQEKLPLPASDSPAAPSTFTRLRFIPSGNSSFGLVAVQSNVVSQDGAVKSSQVLVYRLTIKRPQGIGALKLLGVCESSVGPLQDIAVERAKVSMSAHTY